MRCGEDVVGVCMAGEGLAGLGKAILGQLEHWGLFLGERWQQRALAAPEARTAPREGLAAPGME